MVAHACNPSTWGVEAGRPEVQEQSGLFWDPVSRKDKAQTTETAQQCLAGPPWYHSWFRWVLGGVVGDLPFEVRRMSVKFPTVISRNLSEAVNLTHSCFLPVHIRQCSCPSPPSSIFCSTFMNPNFVRTLSQKSRVGFQAIWPNVPSPF